MNAKARENVTYYGRYSSVCTGINLPSALAFETQIRQPAQRARRAINIIRPFPPAQRVNLFFAVHQAEL